MLILGANTKRKKKLLGSTVQKVAQKSHLPVLIVKNRAKSPYKNIVAPTDFQMQSKQSILFAKHIFPTTSITAVHAFDTIYSVNNGPYTALGQGLTQYYTLGRSYAKKEMKSFIKDVFVQKGKVIDGELNSKATLAKYINKNSYDLVVLGSRSTAGFNALLGSVATYIMRETRSDVLVYVP
jgi:nucleotide-binding universal stress UspA family protein